MKAASVMRGLAQGTVASVALASMVAVVGCDGEPIKDERPNQILSACCDAARAQVEIVQDVETSKFRDRCGSCRVGKSKGDCQAAARRVFGAVSRAYASSILPGECSTLREQLGEYGISIP